MSDQGIPPVDVEAIRARCEAATRYLGSPFNTKARGDFSIDGVARALRDVDALLAEIDRLRALSSTPASERIEGIAWLDGDAFCPGLGEGRCQESWAFVPECEHESADKAAATKAPNERRAMLILLPEEPSR